MMRTVFTLAAVTALAAAAFAVPVRAVHGAKTPPKSAPKATAKGKGGAKAPKMAVCPVCAVKEGKQVLEPVKASLKYKGKMYYFCNLPDKAEFISNPAKYASAVK